MSVLVKEDFLVSISGDVAEAVQKRYGNASASLQQKGGQLKYCIKRIVFVILLFLSETVGY